jgi:uncharacterized protein
MTQPKRYRAWRFFHPDLDASAASAGLALTARGSVAMVEGQDSVRQAILLLLSTKPGERVMRPDYGSHLHRLVFSPNDDTTAGLAIHYVRRALETWEPRIEILKINAERGAGASQPGRADEGPNGRGSVQEEALEIYLEYRVRATRRVEQLSFALDLMGEA